MNKVLWALAVGAALGAAFGEAAQAGKREEARKVVTAQEFQLVDAEGRRRLFINLNKEGDPMIALLDRTGKVRASLGLNKDGGPGLDLMVQGQISFWDKNDEMRFGFHVNDEGRALKIMRDEKGNLTTMVP